MVDFRRARPYLYQLEFVSTYRYLGLCLDTTLDWLVNIDILYKKGLAELPEEIGVVYHLQQILVYILPVSYHQCSLLCAGVLVRQHP